MAEQPRTANPGQNLGGRLPIPEQNLPYDFHLKVNLLFLLLCINLLN